MLRLVPRAARFGLLALLAVLLASPAAATAAVDAVEDDLLARVNAVRAGTPALQHHRQLAAAAEAQAAWIATLTAAERAGLTAQTAHCGGPGCPDARAAAAGWPDQRAILAEIAQFGGRAQAPSPQAANDAAIAAWQASPSHRAQLFAAGWRVAGVAIVQDITVVVFGEACRADGCVPGAGTGQRLGSATAGGGTAGAGGGSADGGSASGSGGSAGSGGGASDGSGGTPSGDAASGTARATRRDCVTRGRVRVLPRKARRAAVEVRVSCKQPGRTYRVRVADGRRRRTVPLKRTRTVVRLPASRRARWVRVAIDEGRRPLGSVRVRVGA